MPKLLLATDAWYPQVNGVVRTLDNTLKRIEQHGYQYTVIHPNLYRNVPAPLYPEIRLAFPGQRSVRQHVEDFAPDHIHIATEGPIGQAVRKYCVKNGYAFSTSFHTLFPDYLQAMAGVPARFTWKFFEWFHRAAGNTLVPTNFIRKMLEGRGFSNLRIWSRGIDQEIFYPHERILQNETGPVNLYVGRVSREKNIDAFLQLDIPGSKYVVGDGPYRKVLEKRYPDTHFVGYKKGHELASYFSSADVFVFPSKTDTFGNVVLESLACGTPVAAYPLAGPLEIVTADSRLGAVDEDLQSAVLRALQSGNKEYCAEYARGFSWDNACAQFLAGLVSLATT